MNSVNHGSTCPTSGCASARFTRGLMQEGPGVSISLVGGRNSAIGSNMLNNLFFALYGVQVCRPALLSLWTSTHLSRTNCSHGGRTSYSLKALVQEAPQVLVCAIPLQRATSKMALTYKE